MQQKYVEWHKVTEQVFSLLNIECQVTFAQTCVREEETYIIPVLLHVIKSSGFSSPLCFMQMRVCGSVKTQHRNIRSAIPTFQHKSLQPGTPPIPSVF